PKCGAQLHWHVTCSTMLHTPFTTCLVLWFASIEKHLDSEYCLELVILTRLWMEASTREDIQQHII
ncbi:hypothetical protein ACJX0J_025956, partial [Zea mays]